MTTRHSRVLVRFSCHFQMVKEWLDHYLLGINRYQLSTSTARNSLSEQVWPDCEEIPIWWDQDLRPACPSLLVDSAQAVGQAGGPVHLTILVTCRAVWWEKDEDNWQAMRLDSDRKHFGSFTMKEITWKNKRCIPLNRYHVFDLSRRLNQKLDGLNVSFKSQNIVTETD